VAAWYLFVKLGNVPKFVMPSPAATLDALLQPNYGWWTNVLVTGTEIFAGYFLALVVGVGLALVFTWSKALEAFFMPLLVSLNMIPKVALGPLIIVWFKYGILPNSIMAFSICVFPILLTTARGLREIEPELLDLVRSLKGSRWQLFSKVQLPGALPLHLFRHEGGGDPGGCRRHRRRVPRLRPRARLPDAAGAGHARHRRHVHGGDPDHADRHGALRAGARARAHAGRARARIQ
jgi:hypothetical protein